MGERWLILETSGRGGRVGVAVGAQVVRSADLDPVRRHNRDLAPTAAALLEAEGIKPTELTGVMVSVALASVLAVPSLMLKLKPTTPWSLRVGV